MKDEAVLLKAAKKLDQEALTTIFDQYAPAIHKYVLRFYHDPMESDNIVGAVFEQLLEKLAAGQGPLTNLRAYLYQIAYHIVSDGARHNLHFPPIEMVSDATSSVPIASIQAQVEERALMDSFISALNQDLNELQRHVIILRFLEDFSLRETAAIIGKTVNHVKVIQSRGITKLRKSQRFQLE